MRKIKLHVILVLLLILLLSGCGSASSGGLDSIEGDFVNDGASDAPVSSPTNDADDADTTDSGSGAQDDSDDPHSGTGDAQDGDQVSSSKPQQTTDSPVGSDSSEGGSKNDDTQVSPSGSGAGTVLKYSTLSDNTVLTVTGAGVDRDYYFTLNELKLFTDGYFEGEYFSLAKDPVELTNDFSGIRLSYLLNEVVGISADATKVKLSNSSDGYSYTPRLSEVSATYKSDIDADAVLYMILAWEEDGSALAGLRIVRGQIVSGEYNRQCWVNGVNLIEVIV